MSGPSDRLAVALADRYRIERELGGGGMSRVYLAEELALGRQVVVKVIGSELREGLSADRFAREVRLAARLQQANIVPVLSAGEAAGIPFYTMPWVRGDSLRARLAGGVPIPLGEALGILRDVARALAYAHGEGIVHRDIKPENILLSHGAAVVTDFGIAKALAASLHAGPPEAGGAGPTLTRTGSALGTPAYMAPEQVAGDPNTDHRADLYAWGLLAWETLTGRHPFANRTPQALLAAQMSEAPEVVTAVRTEVPAPVSDLIRRCLSKDPAARPASADELLAALGAVVTPATTDAAGLVQAPRRSVVRTVAVGVVVLALVGLAALGIRRQIGGAAAPADRSIAVLPLANLSGDPSDDYFGVGLAEEITRALARNGVRVIGRVSAGALLARGYDERAIARELGVGSLLTGTVQRAPGQLRINVSLVSAADGTIRWTERYDRPTANIFAVQDEIARTVSATLLGSLDPGPRAAVRSETADPEAHALYLQGMVLFNRRGAGQLQQAIGLFERAAARDPRYARPRAGLAMALAVLPAYVQESTAPIVRRAIAAAERAIAIDSTIPESYVALGYAYALLDELDRSEQSFRRALSLDSTSTAWGWYALLAARRGDFRAAHERTARALALEPASLIARVWESQILEQERRPAAADSAAAAAIALDSTFTLAWVWRATALLAMGRHAEAIALLERRAALLPPGRLEELHSMLPYAYAKAGRAAEARQLLERIRLQSGGRLPSTGAIAATLEELGEHAAAVALFEEAVAQHDVWTVQFPRSARYDRLRKDPRVAALLEHLGRKE